MGWPQDLTSIYGYARKTSVLHVLIQGLPLLPSMAQV